MSSSASKRWVYGSLELNNVQTVSYEQSAMTDQAGVDLTTTKYNITVRGLLAPGSIPATTGESGADVLERLKVYFRHRRYFLYAVGGKVVVEVGDSTNPNDPESNLDAANGPKIIRVSAPLVTDISVLVEVTIEVVTVPCTAADRAIITHRFSEAHDYDEAGYINITTTGTIYLRSDKTVSFKDALSSAGVPRIRNGFQRIQSKAAITPDNLRIEYTLIDKEFFAGPPPEAASCNVKTDVAQVNSASVSASVSVSLRGKRNADISYSEYFTRLFERAILIADINLRPFRLVVDGRAQTPSVRFSKDETKGEINLQVTCIADPKRIQSNGVFRFDVLGQSGIIEAGLIAETTRPVGHDWSDPDARVLDAFRAAFQEPCGTLYILPTTPKFTGILTGGGGPTPNSGTPGGEVLVGENPLDGELTGGGTTGGGGGGGNTPIGPGNPGFTEQNDPTYQFPPNIGTDGPQVVGASVSTSTGGAITPINTGGEFGGNSVDSGGVDPTSQSVVSPTTGGGSSTAYSTKTTEARVPYKVCVFLCTTTINEGVTVVPSAGRPTVSSTGVVTYPSAIKIRQHNPIGKLVIRWTLERAQVRPLAPDPIPPDEAGLVLESREIDEPHIDQMPSGQFIFKLTGTYTYTYLDVSKARELNALGPLIINDYLLTRQHRREATPSQPVSLWHTFLNIPGLPENEASNLLRQIVPAEDTTTTTTTTT